MTADDWLLTPGPGDEPSAERSAPKGWEPGYEWDGVRGLITTSALAEPPSTWDQYIRDANLDPAEVMVVGVPQVRGWDANMGGGVVQRFHYYRISLVRRAGSASINELIELVNQAKPAKGTKPDGDWAFVLALGDLQIGKVDGDGIEGTIQRFLDGVEAARLRLGWLRRQYPIGHVHIAWLGDCVEGFVSQGGANSWRTVATMSEQVRIVRRLMLHTVQTFAPLTPKLTVVSVPGNHDEPQRFGGRGITRHDDSWAVESLVAVGDAIGLNPRAFGHVQLLTPGRDELTVTADIAGTVIAHAHGHQWNRDKHFDWWSGQTFGEQHPGAATLLLAGHLHHLVVDTFGRKTFMQVPSLEQESTYYRHRKGASGNPGMVTFVTKGQHWAELSTV